MLCGREEQTHFLSNVYCTIQAVIYILSHVEEKKKHNTGSAWLSIGRQISRAIKMICAARRGLILSSVLTVVGERFEQAVQTALHAVGGAVCGR